MEAGRGLRLYRPGDEAAWDAFTLRAAGRVVELGRRMPEYDAARGDAAAVARLALSWLRAAAKGRRWESAGDVLALLTVLGGLMERDALLLVDHLGPLLSHPPADRAALAELVRARLELARTRGRELRRARQEGREEVYGGT